MCLFLYVFGIVDFLTMDCDLTCCHRMHLLIECWNRFKRTSFQFITDILRLHNFEQMRLSTLHYILILLTYNNKLEMGQHYPLLSIFLMPGVHVVVVVVHISSTFRIHIENSSDLKTSGLLNI